MTYNPISWLNSLVESFKSDDLEKRNFALEIVKTLGLGITGISLLFTVWEGLEDRNMTHERLVTERFSKAVEHLQSEDETVRIGGIYALERIAKDSERDYWTIMDLLTSYVRNKYPYSKTEAEQQQKKANEPEADNNSEIGLQAVLIVFGKRQSMQENGTKNNRFMSPSNQTTQNASRS